MSKTTKDDPYWVKSNDPARRGNAHHRCRAHGVYYREGDCDIDMPLEATGNDRRCRYFVGDHVQSRYRYTRGPSKAERHLDYWAPNRRRVRDSVADVKGQHRAGHDIDDSKVELGGHRHAPGHGGYWD